MYFIIDRLEPSSIMYIKQKMATTRLSDFAFMYPMVIQYSPF